MQKITVALAIVAASLAIAALLGITFAQLTTPNPTSTPVAPTATPWYIDPNTGATASYCPHTGAQEGYCNNGTGTIPPNCQNGAASGNCAGPQTQGCHGYGAPQGCSQYGYGAGMMGRGMGMRWR